ncbi:transmembrane protein, putative [Medicago truncatula]|uniref:Transmembrane protein, putative n=1 Tax=Medicago truncatula TaxID=3880 RepID=A0A072UFC1_MEDTR|nr:transmembrane protein, putative [Medicago truncatula]
MAIATWRMEMCMITTLFYCSQALAIKQQWSLPTTAILIFKNECPSFFGLIKYSTNEYNIALLMLFLLYRILIFEIFPYQYRIRIVSRIQTSETHTHAKITVSTTY